MSRALAPLIEEARRTLSWVAENCERPLLAYSGGKDSIVVAHMARDFGIRRAVCETSFYFKRQRDNVRDIASWLGLDVEWSDALDLNWLRRHPEVLFSNSSKVRSWSFAQRHQKAVKRHARAIGADCQIFGRRTEENSVKDLLYRTRAGLQCHPIRNWREDHVWQYFAENGIPVPWIYGTPFGRIEGNAPFYTLRAKDYGTVGQCWKLVSRMDPAFTKENLFA